MFPFKNALPVGTPICLLKFFNRVIDFNSGSHSGLIKIYFTPPQLNDRVFVDNEGVSSLNYQEGDKYHPFAPKYETPRLPAIIRVDEVTIKNGKIGRSSHAGIHGNGASNVKIVNVEIFDFEVCILKNNSIKLVNIIFQYVFPLGSRYSMQRVPRCPYP